MIKYTRIVPVILIFCGVCLLASADRGGFVKKNKTHLNINTSGNLKNSIAFNLKSGMTYRGSSLLNQQEIGSSVVSDALVSYKKGNKVYNLPYNQKILITEYTLRDGYKLIIRPRK
jgi:hypothetical protein